MLGSAGLLTRPAGCPEARPGRVLEHHQLSKAAQIVSSCAAGLGRQFLLWTAVNPAFAEGNCAIRALYRPLQLPETGTGRAPAGTTKRFPTAPQRRRRLATAPTRPWIASLSSRRWTACSTKSRMWWCPFISPRKGSSRRSSTACGACTRSCEPRRCEPLVWFDSNRSETIRVGDELSRRPIPLSRL
jgi:hypothetical protein